MDKELVATLKNVHKARSDIYNFLDRCFRLLPDEDFMTMIKETKQHLQTIAGNSDNADLKEGVAGIEEFFKVREPLKGDELAEYDLEALRRYTSLFCLSDSVPMVESYFTSPEKLVMQDSRDEVLKVMRKYGFKRGENIKEYDDHIAVEMAFIGRLASMSADMLNEENISKYNELIEEQSAFHKNHFDRWISLFAADVQEYAVDEKLFKPLVKFIKGYISEDKVLLDDIKNEEFA